MVLLKYRIGIICNIGSGIYHLWTIFTNYKLWWININYAYYNFYSIIHNIAPIFFELGPIILRIQN